MSWGWWYSSFIAKKCLPLVFLPPFSPPWAYTEERILQLFVPNPLTLSSCALGTSFSPFPPFHLKKYLLVHSDGKKTPSPCPGCPWPSGPFPQSHAAKNKTQTLKPFSFQTSSPQPSRTSKTAETFQANLHHGMLGPTGHAYILSHIWNNSLNSSHFVEKHKEKSA